MKRPITILQKLREINGWDREEVAARVRCNADHYARIEQRNRTASLGLSARLALLYVTNIRELFELDHRAKLL